MAAASPPTPGRPALGTATRQRSTRRIVRSGGHSWRNAPACKLALRNDNAPETYWLTARKTGKGDAMRYLVSGSLVLAGVIHLLPLSGLLGAERLAALYGLDFSEPNLSILMRHRAVLFGLLGAFLVFAAFRPSLQTLRLRLRLRERAVIPAAGVVHRRLQHAGRSRGDGRSRRVGGTRHRGCRVRSGHKPIANQSLASFRQGASVTALIVARGVREHALRQVWVRR